MTPEAVPCVYIIQLFPADAMTEDTTEALVRVVAVFVSLLLVLFTIRIYQYVVRPPKRRSVAIIVLGDVGRSPRMMYHAESFAKLGFDTYLIGYRGEWPSSFLTRHYTDTPCAPRVQTGAFSHFSTPCPTLLPV